MHTFRGTTITGFALGAGLSVIAADRPSRRFESPLRDSPIEASSSPAAALNAYDPVLEFRGVVVEGACTFFSIFDDSSGLTHWVALNEAGHRFTVRSYDDAKVEVRIVFQGREITLGLTSKMKPGGSISYLGVVTLVAAPSTEMNAVEHLAVIAQAAARRLALGQ